MKNITTRERISQIVGAMMNQMTDEEKLRVIEGGFNRTLDALRKDLLRVVDAPEDEIGLVVNPHQRTQ